MYLTVVRDLKTHRRQTIFELSKTDFENTRNNLLRKNERYFETLIKKKDLKTLKKLRDELAEKYASLDKVNEEILAVDILDLPLLLGRKPVACQKPKMEDYPKIIRRSDAKYNQEMSFFTKLFMKRIIDHYRSMQSSYLKDNDQWLEEFDKIQSENDKRQSDYEKEIKKYKQELSRYQQKKEMKEEALKKFDLSLRRKDSESIKLFLEYLLANVDLPLKDFQHTVHVNSQEEVLRIEILLPYVENLVPIKNVRYIKSRDEIRITEFNSTELNKIYHPFIMKYIAVISALIRKNIDYFEHQQFVINGKIKARNRSEEVVTISTQTSADNLFDPSNGASVSRWFDQNDAFVGKKLSNRTALKKVY